MKKIAVIFFLLFSTNVFSHPLGIGDSLVDINFKCIDKKNLDREINFGFKEYTYQKDNSKILLSVPLIKKSNKYDVPSSTVYEFGSYSIDGINYDNMHVWFEHGYLNNEIYVFRRALVNKNNNYLLNDSLFTSKKILLKKLNKLEDRIADQIKKDNDKTVNLLRKYSNTAFNYVLANAKDTYFKNSKLKCSLE